LEVILNTLRTTFDFLQLLRKILLWTGIKHCKLSSEDKKNEEEVGGLGYRSTFHSSRSQHLSVSLNALHPAPIISGASLSMLCRAI
jgi:hypothetical protein